LKRHQGDSEGEPPTNRRVSTRKITRNSGKKRRKAKQKRGAGKGKVVENAPKKGRCINEAIFASAKKKSRCRRSNQKNNYNKRRMYYKGEFYSACPEGFHLKLRNWSVKGTGTGRNMCAPEPIMGYEKV